MRGDAVGTIKYVLMEGAPASSIAVYRDTTESQFYALIPTVENLERGLTSSTVHGITCNIDDMVRGGNGTVMPILTEGLIRVKPEGGSPILGSKAYVSLDDGKIYGRQVEGINLIQTNNLTWMKEDLIMIEPSIEVPMPNFFMALDTSIQETTRRDND